MTIFDPYYWRVILETTAGKFMLAVFLVDLFLIIESFSRKSLWRVSPTGLRKRFIILRTSGILLPLLGASAYLRSLSRSFDALRVASISFDRALLGDAAYRVLVTFFTGLLMGILVLVCLVILEIRAESEKAKRNGRSV